MMHPKPNHRLLFLLAIYFLCVLCGNAEPGLGGNCSEQFQCGNLPNVSYPFWGGSQASNCGSQSFWLNCQGKHPLLNISSLSYRVLKIDMSAQTLIVMREDLGDLEHHCPRSLRNTTLDPEIFKFLPDSNYRNITLLFDCGNYRPPQKMSQKQFSCDADGVKTIGYVETGDATGGPGHNFRCKSSIYVPVHSALLQILEPYNLQNALGFGFSVQWLDYVPSRNLTRPCNKNNNCNRLPTDPAEDKPHGLNHGPGAAAENERKGHGPKSGQSKSTRAIGRILGITIGATVLIIIIIFLRLKRRCAPCRPHQGSNQDVELSILQHGSLAVKRYKYSEIKKITKSFSDKLGQGGYGSVYRGMLPDGCLVAVKVLFEKDDNGEEFINEVDSISRTSHINIVSLLGFCYHRNKRALIYEFMPNKSLEKFISNRGSHNAACPLDFETLYKIAIGVAKGLDYLHTSCSTRIVHFDIKPENILLDEDFCPKISDFGLAKMCKKKQSFLSTVGARGTIGYIAPEIFSWHVRGVSHKADVYSFGMMVLEMVEARKNLETPSIQSSENYFPERIYEHATLDVSKKFEDAMDEKEEEKVRKLLLVGLWCIQTTPSDRPSMCKVVEMLDGSLQTIQIPPKPTLFSPNLSGQELSPSFSTYVDSEWSITG